MGENQQETGDEVAWWQRRFVVLGAWTLLIVLCWVFHWWRVYAAINFDWGFDLIGFPVLLLVVDIVVIGLGFWFLRYPAVAGATTQGRFYATVYVGALSVVSMSLLFVDVFRNIWFGVSYISG